MIRIACLSLFLCLATNILAESGADLVPQIADPVVLYDQTVSAADVAEHCAAAENGRTLVRFSLLATNIGDRDLVVGNPGCPDCSKNPDGLCVNPLYQCSGADGHNHGHFLTFARYGLYHKPRNRPPVAVSRKQGFCITDSLCDHPKFNCGFQGLTAGCTDIYKSDLGCQYVDATDLPPGRYMLRAELNYANIINETNYNNNVDTDFVELCQDNSNFQVKGVRSKKRPGFIFYELKGEVKLNSSPISRIAPQRDGVMLRVQFGSKDPSEIVILSALKRADKCSKRDGWRKLRRKRKWLYQNKSGFLDRACTISSGGVKSIKIRRTLKGFTYRVRGFAPQGMVQGLQSAGAVVVLGEATGPCISAQATSCNLNVKGETIESLSCLSPG
ncbi:MAG: hypothetical protein D6719_03710 [Candidatus Dadabacteria bacterium]|nr:MAG: hypothetical protein D6719_03710 [Candidatus Dadabacteria bacterium]